MGIATAAFVIQFVCACMNAFLTHLPVFPWMSALWKNANVHKSSWDKLLSDKKTALRLQFILQTYELYWLNLIPRAANCSIYFLLYHYVPLFQTHSVPLSDTSALSLYFHSTPLLTFFCTVHSLRLVSSLIKINRLSGRVSPPHLFCINHPASPE